MSLKWLLGLEMNGKTVLDIGAHRGIYSYWMSKAVGPQGSVFAFEPQPECVVHLEKVKTEFQLANLKIVPQGLSENKGTLPLWREYPESGSSTMESLVDAKQGNYEAIAASVTTLDDFFLSKDVRPALIKCDVEGHELSVFLGGKTLLEKYHPDILFECHDRQAQEGHVFAFLENLGYRGYFYESAEKHNSTEFDKVPYPKPSRTYRNYIFSFGAK
ncbi:FkbM family methyltransferase [Planctomycetota bacterium]|nr:FkbM family methyltransferase [Planctomycetota bacterium]